MTLTHAEVQLRDRRGLDSRKRPERKNRDKRESGILVKDSNRMPRFLDKVFERPHQRPFPNLLTFHPGF